MRSSVLLALLLLPSPATAAAQCSLGAQPAATLLIPYFEVDLANANGATTLFAVGNADPLQPVIARVQLWTDWAIPTLGFDLVLGRNDLQTINLRDVFAGVLPVANIVVANCTAPISNGSLSAAELENLRKQHSGQPSSSTGLCSSSDRGSGKALGFITVDVMNSCANGGQRNPTAPGYFTAQGAGLASNRNVLYGDFFLLEPGQDFAQGDVAIHLPADGARGLPTFYGWADSAGADGRAPLPTRQRARFLNGGAFSGGTNVILWAQPSSWRFQPIPCGSLLDHVDVCQQLSLSLGDENGAPGDAAVGVLGPVSQRLGLFSDSLFRFLNSPPAFGFFDVSNRTVVGCFVIPIGTKSLQVAATVLHSASGRFSVGLGAVSTACVE